METSENSEPDISMDGSRESTPTPPECPHPTPLRPLHIKIAWDSNINWENLAQKLFDPVEPCLVMAEKLNAATGHVHMQGTCKVSERSLKRIREDLHNDHGLVKEYKRKKSLRPELYKTKRPPIISKRMAKEPDEKGFQYVCKEGKNVPLYSHGFSEVDLETLFEQSAGHVNKLKATCATYVENLIGEGTLAIPPALCAGTTRLSQPIPREEIETKAKQFYDDALFRVGRAHIADGKNINPRFFKTQILNALVRRPELHEHAQRVLFRLF